MAPQWPPSMAAISLGRAKTNSYVFGVQHPEPEVGTHAPCRGPIHPPYRFPNSIVERAEPLQNGETRRMEGAKAQAHARRTTKANELPGICTTLPSSTCHHPGHIRAEPAVRRGTGHASPRLPLGITPVSQVPLTAHGISGISIAMQAALFRRCARSGALMKLKLGYAPPIHTASCSEKVYPILFVFGAQALCPTPNFPMCILIILVHVPIPLVPSTLRVVLRSINPEPRASSGFKPNPDHDLP
ncbi:hypothetical protein FDECE_8856 [Fusarium decemcellulare]|nr:hypothetical protein FDECE_8856 [Fusarium decemcellulare]